MRWPGCLGRWCAQKWGFWVDLFSRQETGDVLAAFRVAVGCVVLHALFSAWYWDIVQLVWIESKDGGMRIRLGGNWLVQRLGGPTPTVVWSLFLGALGSALLFVAGLGGRVTALALLQTYFGLTSINNDASGGYDLMVTNALWLCVLGDTTRTWSLDCFLRHRRWSSHDLVMAWPRYLAIFQLVTVYTSTGWQKLSVWWSPAGSYTSLYYTLQDTTWTRFDGEIWAHPILFFVTQVGTAITWHFEQTTPLLLLVLYFRYTAGRPGRLRRACNRFDLRKPWVLVGIGLHSGILILMNVGPFSWISWSYYLVLMTPNEMRGVMSAINLRLKSMRGRLTKRTR